MLCMHTYVKWFRIVARAALIFGARKRQCKSLTVYMYSCKIYSIHIGLARSASHDLWLHILLYSAKSIHTHSYLNAHTITKNIAWFSEARKKKNGCTNKKKNPEENVCTFHFKCMHVCLSMEFENTTTFKRNLSLLCSKILSIHFKCNICTFL